MCRSWWTRHLPPARLEIVVSGDTDRRDVALRGDLDLETADQLRSALDECAALGTRLVVVGLSEVEFFAVSGLNVLVDAHQALAASRARLALERPSPIVERVLRLTGLNTVLLIHSEPLSPTPSTVTAMSVGVAAYAAGDIRDH